MAASCACAGEHLLGYVKGAEPLPRGGEEFYVIATSRDDKGSGVYHARDFKTEYEYGVTNRLTVSGALKAMSLNTRGIVIDGYLPGDRDFALKASGIEVEALYNFLSPAGDDFGLSMAVGLDYASIDPHSGRKKDTLSAEFRLLAQKYLLEGEVTLLANLGLESTYADRAPIANLPEGFDWPTNPEMEIEPSFGLGAAWRFVPRWYLGGELLYETEFETEVGQERWSWFGGPSLHYAGARWWATLTYLRQLRGGGETYEGQPSGYHLIEKTKSEVRLKVAFNF